MLQGKINGIKYQNCAVHSHLTNTRITNKLDDEDKQQEQKRVSLTVQL